MLGSLSLLIATSAPALAIKALRAIEVGDALWMSRGCYADTVSSRALAQDAFYDDKGMTVDVCLNYCTSGGYPFAGLEYARECYCGLVNLSPGIVDSTECYQNCSGNPEEICGGPERLSLFARPIPEPVANPGVNGYQSLGCYVDTIEKRVLDHFTSVPGGPSHMSVAACTAACSSDGYPLAALEYGGECWCDDHFEFGPAVAHNCNMPCRGNMSELCGGALAFELYGPMASNEPDATTNSQTAVSTSVDSEPAATLHISGTPVGFHEPVATVASPSITASTATSGNATETPNLTFVPDVTASPPPATLALSSVSILTPAPPVKTLVTSAFLNSTSSLPSATSSADTTSTIATIPVPTSTSSSASSMSTSSPTLSTLTSTSTSSTTSTSTSTSTPTSTRLPLIPTLSNAIENPFFNLTTFTWQTVINPSYGDFSNLLGAIATSNLTSAYIIATKPVRASSPRSFCLQQPITLSVPGTYKFTVDIGRQILNGTRKPIPSTDRLQYNMYYDNTLVGGTQDVCNPELGGCLLKGELGPYDEVTQLVQVPFKDIGGHNVAVCGVFSGDATFGLDSIVIYGASFSGPTRGGR